MTRSSLPRTQIIGMLAITVVTFAALWAGLGLSAAWPRRPAPARLHRARRGRPVAQPDDRDHARHRRRGHALALRAHVHGDHRGARFVLPGWWLVTVIAGEPDETLSAVCAVFAVVLTAGAVVQAGRA